MLSFIYIGIYWNKHHHLLQGKLSPVLYVIAIPAAFVSPWIAGAIYVLVALVWLVPARRIEKAIETQ